MGRPFTGSSACACGERVVRRLRRCAASCASGSCRTRARRPRRRAAGACREPRRLAAPRALGPAGPLQLLGPMALARRGMRTPPPRAGSRRHRVSWTGPCPRGRWVGAAARAVWSTGWPGCPAERGTDGRRADRRPSVRMCPTTAPGVPAWRRALRTRYGAVRVRRLPTRLRRGRHRRRPRSPPRLRRSGSSNGMTPRRSR